MARQRNRDLAERPSDFGEHDKRKRLVQRRKRGAAAEPHGYHQPEARKRSGETGELSRPGRVCQSTPIHFRRRGSLPPGEPRAGRGDLGRIDRQVVCDSRIAALGSSGRDVQPAQSREFSRAGHRLQHAAVRNHHRYREPAPDPGRAEALLLSQETAMNRFAIILLAVCAYAADIPKTWDNAAIASFELPLVVREYSPVHVLADFYYQVPVRAIYKSYPIYAPGRGPAGYLDWLKQQEPAIAFDPERIRTKDDWVRSGELVFDAPTLYDTDGPFAGQGIADAVGDPAWYRQTGVPIAGDGTAPYLRYVIRKKGVLEIGMFSCAMCHTRVMPDGSVLKGAQGNLPFERIMALIEHSYEDRPAIMTFLRRGWRFLYG